jgi:CDGSH iron-sulfur domain-containing protein 3
LTTTRAVVFSGARTLTVAARAANHWSEENHMSRLINHTENGPYEVPEGTALPIYVCGCGLSKNKPFCDGSHKKTRAEAAGEVYEYDANGNAKLVQKH